MFKSFVNHLSWRSPAVINALLALWFTCIANITFFQTMWQLTPHHGFKSVLFLVVTFVLLWAYLNFFLQLITWSKLARPIQTLLLFFATIGAYAIDSFNVVIDVSQVQNLMETDRQEILDLLSINLLTYCMILFFIPMYWLWSKPIIKLSLKNQLKQKLLFIGLSLTSIVIIASVFFVDYAAMFREHRTLRYLINPINSVNAFSNYFNTKINFKHNLFLCLL